MKVQILSVCLLVSASATPFFTNSGFESVTCQWVGEVPPTGSFYKTYTAAVMALALNPESRS